MKPKILPCSECGDDKPKPVAYSRGTNGASPYHLCQYHNKIRKGVRQPLAKKPKPTGELALFTAIWHTRKRVSFLSGKQLGEFNVAYFAHVISKKQEPKLRLTDKNIILLTKEEHNLYDQGTEEQRQKYAALNNCDWNKIHALKEALKHGNHTQD